MIKDLLKQTLLYNYYYIIRYKTPKWKYGKIMTLEETFHYICSNLKETKPFMVSRFGSAELKIILNYIKNKPFSDANKKAISVNAGFFPATDKNLRKLALLYINEIKKIDLLEVFFNRGELYTIRKFNPSCKYTLSKHISFPMCNDTFYYSQCLKDKKVLVIHPFEESIKMQYKKRHLLFDKEDKLPKFDLITIKAIQSIGGYHESFETWFDALEYMKDKILKVNFDIALIGAGAYGLPLAGFIKSLGKKAIHIGGALQLWFGIMGARWEQFENIKKLTNKHWIRPAIHERPKEFKKVENGCYW